MKKILTIAAAVMLLAIPAANAQSLFGRLAEKASNAVSKRVSEKVSDKVSDVATEKMSEMTGVDVKAMNNNSFGGLPVTDSKETLQPKRSSTFGWDGVVTPSATKFPIPLMNEFPAVPAASKLANPSEADQIAYYKAIKAVTLRAEELNADTTCEDSFTEKWRAEAEQAMMDAFGLSAAEYQALKDNTLSEAEKEKLTERMRAKILGGVDEKSLMADLEKGQNMGEEAIEDRAVAAACAVYDRHSSELPKYTGCTAAEFKKATRESMNSDNSAASRAIEKKADAYMKALPAAQKKEAEAFMANLKRELMNAALDATPGARSALAMSQNLTKFSNQLSPLMEKYQKIEKYGRDIMAAMPQPTWKEADAVFSVAERKKVENIKSQIYATDNASVYNPLYLQAMELIKTYRDRAAQVWAADVQKRFDSVKNSMGNVIKIQRQAIEDGIIPECSLWRVPLNLVIYAGDILAEAYSEFPSNYPPMYNEEVVRQLKIGANESAWWPEFYVTSDLDNVLSGKNIYKESNGKVYQFNAGSWSPVGVNFEQQAAPVEAKPASASWRSSDGKREVIYNAEGGFLQFPEGDIIYPTAWEKRGNAIIWAEIVNESQPDGSVLYKIIKCTYKL